jgi:hypothetical protein
MGRGATQYQEEKELEKVFAFEGEPMQVQGTRFGA